MTNKLKRTEPCDVCDNNIIVVDESFEQRGDIVNFQYEETCFKCGNLLYGFARKVN